MAASAKSGRLGFPVVFAVWTLVVIAAWVAGVWMGYSGRSFATALLVAAALFAFELFLAVPGVFGRVRSVLASGNSLAVLFPLACVLIYSLTVTGNWKLTLFGVGYVIIPCLLLAGTGGSTPGTWHDYMAAILLWIPVWAQWLYWVFPYPAQLTHTLAVLLAMCTGVAVFLLQRRLDDVGYAFEWRSSFGLNFALHFVVFTAIAIPLGLRMHFLTYAPSIHRLQPLVIIGIPLFTAWPEEFLFRGILQNLLSRSFGNEWAGLIVASIVFGFSHIQHAPFPNWKYVLLASIAGFFYGHAWMKTKSLVPGALMHALVDISWHVLFR